MNRGLLLNSSLAVPRSITGCFAMQNIGEVVRSDGGIRKYRQWKQQSPANQFAIQQAGTIPPIFNEELKRGRKRNAIHIIRQDNATKGH